MIFGRRRKVAVDLASITRPVVDGGTHPGSAENELSEVLKLAAGQSPQHRDAVRERMMQAPTYGQQDGPRGPAARTAPGAPGVRVVDLEEMSDERLAEVLTRTTTVIGSLHRRDDRG